MCRWVLVKVCNEVTISIFVGWLLEWIWKICASIRSAGLQWHFICGEQNYSSHYHLGKFYVLGVFVFRKQGTWLLRCDRHPVRRQMLNFMWIQVTGKFSIFQRCSEGWPLLTYIYISKSAPLRSSLGSPLGFAASQTLELSEVPHGSEVIVHVCKWAQRLAFLLWSQILHPSLRCSSCKPSPCGLSEGGTMKPVENWNCSSTGWKAAFTCAIPKEQSSSVCHEQQHLSMPTPLQTCSVQHSLWLRCFYYSAKHHSILCCFLKHGILYSYGFCEI